MTLAVSGRRKIVVQSGDRRTDVALPLGESIGTSLQRLGFALNPGSFAILSSDNVPLSPETSTTKLDDGDLISVVDLYASPLSETRNGSTASASSESNVVWWALAAIGLIASVIAIVNTGSGGAADAGFARVLAASILGAGALGVSVVRVRRVVVRGSAEVVAVIAPISLVFAAGALAIDPKLAASAHLAVASGLLAAGVLSSLLTASALGQRVVAVMGVVTVVILILAAIWGVTLLLRMTPQAAAAISIGVVPVGLRFLPTTLVNVAEGNHIDYQHFMSSRWTVRGNIPDSVNRVDAISVRQIVATSTTKMVTGIAVLSVSAAVFYPFTAAGFFSTDIFVRSGSIAVAVCLVLALLLVARHYASPLLRWVPRSAAGIILLELIAVLGARYGDFVSVAIAGGLLLTGIVTAFVLVPIARGAASLVWSRLGDGIEGLAIALALPAALLAADMITLLRGVMS